MKINLIFSSSLIQNSYIYNHYYNNYGRLINTYHLYSYVLCGLLF